MISLALLADACLATASLVSSVACALLARRLRRLSRGDHGLAHALESLDQGVARMEAALAAASQAAAAADRLHAAIAAAEALEARLSRRTPTLGAGATSPEQGADPLADVVPGSAAKTAPSAPSLGDTLEMLTRLEASVRTKPSSGRAA